MAEPHDFDLITGWCKRCGIAREHAVDSNKDCIASAENVTAISHLVRGSELRSVAASILLERRGFFRPDDSA
jgi:hypothetical protein